MAKSGVIMTTPNRLSAEGIADRVYRQLKQEIFDFKLLPGDRFSENDIARRMDASRTPVRQALYSLEQEGYVEVQARSGWQIKAVDFDYVESLYDLRIVLELEAVKRLCARSASVCPPSLQTLKQFWLDSPQLVNGNEVARHDEHFHMALVEAAGNPEMAKVHREITEKIRIVRRLDFTQRPRINATYLEHGEILLAVLECELCQAQTRLHDHIAASQKEVRQITLHMLHQARQHNDS